MISFLAATSLIAAIVNNSVDSVWFSPHSMTAGSISQLELQPTARILERNSVGLLYTIIYMTV